MIDLMFVRYSRRRSNFGYLWAVGQEVLPEAGQWLSESPTWVLTRQLDRFLRASVRIPQGNIRTSEENVFIEVTYVHTRRVIWVQQLMHHEQDFV